MSHIAVNIRNIHAPLTGVQRYTGEILARIQGAADTIDPGPLPGMRGHAWEQFVLPLKLRGRLLWSPGNTGPLAVERQVVTIHDVSTLDYPRAMTARFARWYQFLLPRLARRVRRVITVSEFARDRIIARTGISAERISVIYNGVDHAHFRPGGEEELAEARKALNIPPGEYVLSVLSSFAEHKNPRRLLSAWQAAHRQLSDHCYLLVAGAHARKEIFGAAHLSDLPPRVRLLGYVDTRWLPALYGGAKAFVYVSNYDSFALPVLEAMACGAPVIVNHAAALPEIAGDAGVYVDGMEPAAIAAGIVRIVTDSSAQAEFRAHSLKRAAQFDWSTTATQTLEVLRRASGE